MHGCNIQKGHNYNQSLTKKRLIYFFFIGDIINCIHSYRGICYQIRERIFKLLLSRMKPGK